MGVQLAVTSIAIPCREIYWTPKCVQYCVQLISKCVQLDLFDTSISYPDGFQVRLNDGFRLNLLYIFKSSVIFYKGTKRTLRAAYVQKSMEVLPTIAS